MKRSAYYLLLFCWCIIPLTTWAADDDIPTFTDEEYRARLAALSTSSMEFQFNDLVKERILVRTQKYRDNTEQLLGRGQQFFPIFEHYLAKHDVPHFLKYLPIIESRMNPHARSYAAAVGIWQFIKSTGKMYGLRINSYVDERSDIHRSSEAAAHLLSSLYKRYKDWALVLAAYNCGPLRVNRAIKAAGEADYWAIQKYLPSETRKYVPYFIAVVYVGEYYKAHNLVPQEQAMDLRFTDTLHVHEFTRFSDLAKEMELSEDTVALLNPGFLKKYIPASEKGYVVMLPERIIARKRGYPSILDSYSPIAFIGRNRIKRVHRVRSDERMSDLVKQLRCTERDLRYWNNWDEHYQPKVGDLVTVRSNAAPPPPPMVTHLQKVDVMVMYTKSIDKDARAVQVDRFVEDLSPVPSLESSVPKLAFMPKAQQSHSTNRPVRTRYLRRSAQKDAAPIEEPKEKAVISEVLSEEEELEMPKVVEVPEPSTDALKRELQRQAVAAKEERVISTVPLRGQVEAATHLPSRNRGRRLRRAAALQAQTSNTAKAEQSSAKQAESLSAPPQKEVETTTPKEVAAEKAAEQSTVEPAKAPEKEQEAESTRPVAKTKVAPAKTIAESEKAGESKDEKVQATKEVKAALETRSRQRRLRGAAPVEQAAQPPAEQAAPEATDPAPKAKPNNFRELIEERSEQVEGNSTGHLMQPKVTAPAASKVEEGQRDYLGQMVARQPKEVTETVKQPSPKPKPRASLPKPKAEKASPAQEQSLEKSNRQEVIAKSLDQALEDDDFSYYQVGKGESLDQVANVFPNLTVRDLMELNNITSPHEIRPGMLIKIRIQ